MIQMLTSVIGQRGVDAMAFLLAFALTALTDSIFRDKLPHDHGRAFAVNGELSKGKARGSGLIFVLCIALVSLAFLPFNTEYVVYNVLLIASMLSGYLDDAAETAWNGGRHLPELQWLRGALFAVELHPALCGVPAAHRHPYLGKHQRGQLHRWCGWPFRQSGSGDHWHLPAGL